MTIGDIVMRHFPTVSFACLLLVACSTGRHVTTDGGATDLGVHEGGSADGAPTDGAPSCGPGEVWNGVACVLRDGGPGDAGPLDLGAADLGHDAALLDLGAADLGHDAGAPDLGPPDLGPPDLGPPRDAGPACAAPLHVGLYAADSVANLGAVQTSISGTGRFASVIVGGPVLSAMPTATPPRPASPPPTLAQLDAFDAVLVWGSDSWDGDAFGNVLADYVDQGHGVVIAVFAERAGASVGVEGRMLSGGYLPYVPGTYNFHARSLGPIAVPGHPIMAGVSSFGGTNVAYHIGPLNPLATLVASFDTSLPDPGSPLVATLQPSAGRTVLLGFYPLPGAFWDTSTDGAVLMANALHWSACGD